MTGFYDFWRFRAGIQKAKNLTNHSCDIHRIKKSKNNFTSPFKYDNFLRIDEKLDQDSGQSCLIPDPLYLRSDL